MDFFSNFVLFSNILFHLVDKITLVVEERADFSAIDYCFCSEEFPLPLGKVRRICCVFLLWHFHITSLIYYPVYNFRLLVC